MKRLNKTNNIIKTIFGISAFLIFSSCQIGLGDAIDLQAPEVVLTSHKDSDYVGQSFRLVGYATDNEKVKSITIDFDEADIHYKWENGVWKKKTSYIDWTALTADECVGTVNNTTVNWEVTVNTTEAKFGMQSSTYSYSIVAEDEIGNSGKTSKIEGSLVVDQNTPDIKLNSPTLFNTNNEIDQKLPSFNLKDGSVLSQLFNGTLVFEGRQDSAASFKEFRIELDDGTEDSKFVDSYNFDKPINSVTTENISNAYPFGRKTLYYSKTLKVGQDGIQDLRTWTISIKPEDWISSEKNSALQSKKHKIRLVATSISNSNTWQRKILGFFTWYPEADNPWITLYSGTDSLAKISEDQTYPSAKIFGVVQDDDGIESLTYSLEKQNADSSFTSIKSNKALTLAEEKSKNSQWSVEAPTESAVYKLSVNAKDIYGKTDSVVRYFNVLDVQPPKISLTSPTESTNVFSAGGTSINFAGTISDDAKIKSIKIVHLNPAAENALENKLKYINHAEPDWQKTSDTIGNTIFDVSIPKENYDSTTKIFSYEINKSFDLFADLKIGVDKPLITQDFVILAVDESGGATTVPISVVGDSDSPKLTIESIKLINAGGTSNTISVQDGIIKLPVIKVNSSAIIYGTWSDNSTSYWNDIAKINDINFEWYEAEFKDFKKNGNTWEVTVESGSVPKVDGAITATLKDYANNITSVSQTVTVEKAEIGLERITCDSEDGAYNASKELIINLEFTKSAKFITNDENKKPNLVLNNGAKAFYCGKAEDISSGTSKHQFKYTVSDQEDIQKLDVSSIESNGCRWVDANTTVGFEIQQSEIEALVKSNKTLAQRNIVIDTKTPFVQNIRPISSGGAYKEGKELIFEISFNEDVTVTDEKSVSLVFKPEVKLMLVNTVKSGLRTLLSTYKVVSGNTELSISGITKNGSTVSDSAGNFGTFELNNDVINAINNSIKDVVIDTAVPVAPFISGFTSGDVLIDDKASITVSIEGETGSTISYSIDDGFTWSQYSKEITLNNNGTYKIIAKQVDAAGNKSSVSDTKTVTIDKGAIIKKISATTYDGTYTSGKEIQGFIEFRGPVTVGEDFTVTLNIGENGKTATISNRNLDTNNRLCFTYTIADGDKIVDKKLDKLDVRSLSGKVTYQGKDFTDWTLPQSNFADNRTIKIITGKPGVVVDNGVFITGEDENAKLNITFDRNVVKGLGTITLTQDTTGYRIPTVLTVSEYNELKTVFGLKEGKPDEYVVDDYYKKGVNGATKNADNTLTPDTTTKYILDFEINNDGSVQNTQSNAYSLKNLKELFISKGLNKVSIPIYASAVSVSDSTLTVNLTGAYKLPTKGATYSVTIPAGAVKDEVGNSNDEYAPETKLPAPGVEKPEIRIQKNGYTITNSSADYTNVMQANVKFSCKTPNSSVVWIEEHVTNGSKDYKEEPVNDCEPHTTKTPDVKIQWNDSKENSESITSLGDAETAFDKVYGYKYAIMAKSKDKNGEFCRDSDVAYEYATRTVLKFEIGTNVGGDFNNSMETYKIWIHGGDSTSGDNEIETFPLSWGKSSNFKLMKRTDTDRLSELQNSNWYWVTWDLSAPAYHGFLLGDVPSDASTKGPSEWFVGERTYVPLKSYYVLHPGETLRMQLTTGHDNAGRSDYVFITKNKGTR